MLLNTVPAVPSSTAVGRPPSAALSIDPAGVIHLGAQLLRVRHLHAQSRFFLQAQVASRISDMAACCLQSFLTLCCVYAYRSVICERHIVCLARNTRQNVREYISNRMANVKLDGDDLRAKPSRTKASCSMLQMIMMMMTTTTTMIMTMLQMMHIDD